MSGGRDERAERVAIESLSPNSDSPRLSGENADHAQLLAQIEGRLPPIVVHRASMRVIDGMHRLRAARQRGDTHVDVHFFDGDAAEAFVLAVELNNAHGLPLSLADRKAAAKRIMVDQPRLSDGRIARPGWRRTRWPPSAVQPCMVSSWTPGWARTVESGRGTSPPVAGGA